MLKDIKSSKPIELAEYTVTKNIGDELTFKWWMNKVINKQDQMI